MIPLWSRYVSSSRRAARGHRRPLRPERRACRPCLQMLDDRLAPATLDLSAGTLTFTGADVANGLTLTRAADRYTFNDPLDPITLGPGALAAGYTISGGGATA